jgi:hypothetical protein
MGDASADLIYSMGAEVKPNQNQLGSNLYQEMGAFNGTGTIRLTMSEAVDEGLDLGFIANVLSSQRTAFYASTQRTKRTVSIGAQTLDGDGEAPPFATAPTTAPTEKGTNTLDLAYQDSPLLAFSRVDPKAEDEGKTLTKVAGKDVHKVWLAAGNPADGGVTTLDGKAFEITWDTEINNDTNKTRLGSKSELTIREGSPVIAGDLANDSGQEIEETW